MNLKKILLWLASFQLRILFRIAFLLLAVATVAMALNVLQEEKQRGHNHYQSSFVKTKEQIAAKLRHPTGQLALLNPQAQDAPLTPLHPVILPYSAIDFDDQSKVRHAIEMAGCSVQYKHHGSACVAIGSNPWSGGFIYAAGTFASSELIHHEMGDELLEHAHRLRVTVKLRGEQYRWIAPFELAANYDPFSSKGARGKLTGFVEAAEYSNAKPVKEFRGWIWQDKSCVDDSSNADSCEKKSFFSLRLPIALLRDELFSAKKPVWPPADLNQMEVHIEVLEANANTVIFDTNDASATPLFSLDELKALLLPGELLSISKASAPDKVLLEVSNNEAPPETSLPWINAIIRKLPVDAYDKPIEAVDEISTPTGNYQLRLKGDVRSVNKNLSIVATRLAWFVGAMLLAIAIVWLVIEIGIISRIAALTKRAASLSKTVKASSNFEHFDLAEMRGNDELGILATALNDLLIRVKEDVEREKIRAEQEKDMWHAVGHEIMSPLQSLLVLHGKAEDPASRYIQRMQQAIRILYGQASPSEAFQSSTLEVSALDLDQFLNNIATNAADVGISDVAYQALNKAMVVKADEYSLEDVLTHILRNAERYRTKGSPITMSLSFTETTAYVSILNLGSSIASDMLDKIFEYGVSDQAESGAQGSRGQGLFVAKTYMAKMGGTINAKNEAGGVSFVLSLPRA